MIRSVKKTDFLFENKTKKKKILKIVIRLMSCAPVKMAFKFCTNKNCKLIQVKFFIFCHENIYFQIIDRLAPRSFQCLFSTNKFSLFLAVFCCGCSVQLRTIFIEKVNYKNKNFFKQSKKLKTSIIIVGRVVSVPGCMIWGQFEINHKLIFLFFFYFNF